jgi:hypothetical protein
MGLCLALGFYPGFFMQVDDVVLVDMYRIRNLVLSQ